MRKNTRSTHPLSKYLENKQQHQRIAARQQALRWLAETFPAAFDTQQRIAPLKIGIIQDILIERSKLGATYISVSKLREAVRLFVRRLDYLTTLKAQEMRIDLYGNPIARVSDSEARQAQYRIRKIIHTNISKYEHNNPFKLATNRPKIRLRHATKAATLATTS